MAFTPDPQSMYIVPQPFLPSPGSRSPAHLASFMRLIRMQHTLNSICMTGCFFFPSQGSFLQSVPSGSCQGRGGISLSDADSSCPGTG